LSGGSVRTSPALQQRRADSTDVQQNRIRGRITAAGLARALLYAWLTDHNFVHVQNERADEPMVPDDATCDRPKTSAWLERGHLKDSATGRTLDPNVEDGVR